MRSRVRLLHQELLLGLRLLASQPNLRERSDLLKLELLRGKRTLLRLETDPRRSRRIRLHCSKKLLDIHLLWALDRKLLQTDVD